jgi:RHS repeat-associated protein
MSYSMICERHPDWLGSNRLTSSPSRTALSSIAYGPFGETYAPFGTSDPSFTGQNQDTSGGLYDFLFREYSTQGRWPSPDPAGLAAVDFSDPRSLNRYAYVLNDPLDSVDPYGLCRLRMVSYESGWALEWHGMCWAGNLPHPPCSGFFSVFAWWCGQPPHIPTGIRKKGETFSQCMVRNEKNFSVGGVFDAVLKTNIGKNDLVQIAAGNALVEPIRPFGGIQRPQQFPLLSASPPE